MPKGNLDHYRQEAETILKPHIWASLEASDIEPEAAAKQYMAQVNKITLDALVELHKQSVLELLPKPIDNYTGTDMEDWQKGYNQLRQEIREELIDVSRH